MRSSFLLIVLALAGCSGPVCTRNSDCEKGLVCGDESRCVVPPDMTALPDGGIDLGTADSSAAADLSEREDLALSDADHD